MNNIVFYVHRTGLLGYFINPICSFLSEGYKITILHLDKKNGYNYAPSDSSLYDTIDITGINMKEVEQLLTRLNPKAIILLGFISIYELLMLRVAKKMGIKTIYLEHGIFSKETASLSFRKLWHGFGITVSKNLFFFRRYLEFARHSENFKHEMYVFWHCFRKKEYFLSKFDRALFFAKYGRNEIGKLFNYDDSEVDYICYPLARTDEEYKQYCKIADGALSKDKKATFIHQPFILDGLAQWSYEEERDYFLKIAENLKQYGYTLTIQLHPRSDIEVYQRLFKDTGINIIMNMERAEFKNYSLVLGHYSTALLYPIFFKIPVMLVDYPGVCVIRDSVFYPINCTFPIENVNELTSKYQDFCAEYIGTGSCSFENIARKLCETIYKLS